MTDTIETMRELSAYELNTVSGGCCQSCNDPGCTGFDYCATLYQQFAGGGGGMPGMLQS